MGAISNILMSGSSARGIIDKKWWDEDIPDPFPNKDKARNEILGDPYSDEYEKYFLDPDAKIEKKEIRTILNYPLPQHLVVPGCNPRGKPKKIPRWFYTEEERAKPFAIPESLEPRPATPEQQARLKTFQDWPLIKNNSAFEAIMAVPEIAEAEAARCQAQEDQEGYRHLAALMRYYQSSNRYGPRPDPYMLDFKFPMKFSRFKWAVKRFIDPKQQGNVISDNALRSLYEILGREGYLKDEGHELKAAEMNPKQWEKYYFNQALLPGYYYKPDGLVAALEGCAIRALPDCRTERLPDGRYKVHVDGIYIYMRDIFNFEGWGYLGAWSKNDKHIRLLWGGTYKELSNEDFRDFTAATGIGKDFEVLSRPLKLKIKPFSFDVDPNLSIKKSWY